MFKRGTGRISDQYLLRKLKVRIVAPKRMVRNWREVIKVHKLYDTLKEDEHHIGMRVEWEAYKGSEVGSVLTCTRYVFGVSHSIKYWWLNQVKLRCQHIY